MLAHGAQAVAMQLAVIPEAVWFLLTRVVVLVLDLPSHLKAIVASMLLMVFGALGVLGPLSA